MGSYFEELVQNIKYYRNERSISQAKLAEYCNCSDGTIGLIESGKAKPSLDMLFKIADSLKVHPADLLLRDASKSNKEMKKKIESVLMNDLMEILKDTFQD